MNKPDVNTKKNILVVQQYFYPDISAVSQLLGDLLKETAENSRYNITVLCGSYVRNFEKDYWNTLNWPVTLGKVKIKRIRTAGGNTNNKLYRLLEYIAFYWGAYWYIRKNRKNYDALISMTTPPLIGIVILAANRKRNNSFIYYLEDLYPELLFDMGYIKRYWIINKMRIFNNIILQKADKIITLGRYMTKKLYYNYNISKQKILEIPNWAKGVVFVPPQKHEEFILLYSGNLGLAHDFSLLKPFIHTIEKMKLNLAFRFIGAGRQYSRVKNIFSDYSIKYSFKSYTDRESHSKVLSMADMFIISQREETVGDILPSKFYSYVAAGRPILLLGTEKSEIGHFIKEKEIGRILESEEDISDIILFIKYLQENRNIHRRLCKDINDIYIKEMGFRKSVKMFQNLLSEVLD